MGATSETIRSLVPTGCDCQSAGSPMRVPPTKTAPIALAAIAWASAGSGVETTRPIRTVPIHERSLRSMDRSVGPPKNRPPRPPLVLSIPATMSVPTTVPVITTLSICAAPLTALRAVS